MTSFGIICEFNPLHNGHKRLIDMARKQGADCIVCVMSGNAVQRGELAIADKYARAKAAILCGADLVLELPYPWCAASAEYFAGAGVEVLYHFCDNIIFGSECGDITLLKKAAACASGDDFKTELGKRLKHGDGAASVYFSLLNEACGRELSSNDLLGVEYIRAAEERGFNIEFHTVKREGAAYGDKELGTDICPSATAIRNAWKNGKDASKYIPEEAQRVFEECDRTDIGALSRALLMYFRLADPATFNDIAETDGGIANRIVSVARTATDEKELFESLRTKRYTDAKLRRAILFCLTGVRSALLSECPEYVTLLGASNKGRALLSGVRSNERIRIVTKPADAPRESEQFKVSERLEAIFTLARSTPAALGDSYRKSAFIK